MFGLSAVLGIIAWAELGTVIDDAGNPLGGGATYSQEYEPTNDERNTARLKMFIIAAVVGRCGVAKGRKFF